MLATASLISFPAFVIAPASNRRAKSVMDLQYDDSLTSADCTFVGKDTTCLGWFTSWANASAYLAQAGIVGGQIVTIDNGYQALATLGMRKFDAVVIDPVWGRRAAVVESRASFVEAVRKIVGQDNLHLHLPKVPRSRKPR